MSLTKCTLYLTILLAVPLLYAADPPPTHLIAYQGVLMSPNGTARAPDGQYNLTFRLYTAATGGVAAWTEQHNSVMVKDGFFSVTIGSGTDMTGLNFTQQYYLGVSVNTEAELTPRVKLTGTLYAANAATVGGYPVRHSGNIGVMLRDDFLTNSPGDNPNVVDRASVADTAKGVSFDAETHIDLKSGYVRGGGTAETPAFSFSDDTHTGMYPVSNDVLGFSTGGTERLQLSSTGAIFTGDLSAQKATFTGDLSAVAATVTSLNAGTINGTNISATGTITCTTLNTGHGTNELHAMNQAVRTTDAVTFATLDTGHGANELYAMDQNVKGDSTVRFDKLGVGVSPSIRLAVGDADTGLDWVEDGVLTVKTNNVERLRIDSNGLIDAGSGKLQAQTFQLRNSFELFSEESTTRLTADYDISVEVNDKQMMLVGGNGDIFFHKNPPGDPNPYCHYFNPNMTGIPYGRFGTGEVFSIASRDAGATCLFENKSTTATADLLYLKLGNVAPAATNNFISFYNGNGQRLGRIRGNNNALGITWVSSSGDYAEWLPRADTDETLSPGDVVGVTAGQITMAVHNNDFATVVSTAPIVVGNMPATNEEEAFGNPVVFLGQAPVKVRGPVQAGDFVVASGLSDGTAVAVAASELTPEQVPMVVGKAWESSTADGVKLINTLIGAGITSPVRNLADRLNQLEVENGELRALIADLAKRVAVLEAR